MAEKKQAAYIQFSKRLALFVAVFWGISRIATAVLISLYPSSAPSFLTLQEGSDSIMIFSLGCYCGNSVAEKGILNYFKSKTSATEADEG